MYLPNSNLIESSVSSIYPFLSRYSLLSFLTFPSFPSSGDGLLIPSTILTITRKPLTLVFSFLHTADPSACVSLPDCDFSFLCWRLWTVGQLWLRGWCYLRLMISYLPGAETSSGSFHLSSVLSNSLRSLTSFYFKCLPNISYPQHLHNAQ